MKDDMHIIYTIHYTLTVRCAVSIEWLHYTPYTIYTMHHKLHTYGKVCGEYGVAGLTRMGLFQHTAYEQIHTLVYPPCHNDLHCHVEAVLAGLGEGQR
jgi:hypothetical protein